MAGKFDLQKIINDVKSMITPVPIPEANKDDPVAYYLSELNKLTKELAEAHTKQADIIAKVSPVLGNLYQEVMKSRGQTADQPAAAEKPAETPPSSEGDKPDQDAGSGDTEAKSD